jgi:RNA polymerase sigma-70 factor (ECF subfamily)
VGDLDVFLSHREYLLGVGYRMLGTVAEAEDIVQDAYLRWQAVPADSVDNPGAFLTTMVVRLAMDQLKSARVRRENYVGEWLPEPVLADPLGDGEAAAELADSLSMAFLVLLESLSPLERAAFLLHDVFGYGYPEVAGMLDRSPAACRQLVARGRGHVSDRKVRFDADRKAGQETAAAFLLACGTGDLAALFGLLAEDVVVVSDGGGKVRAGLRPVLGRDKAARFLLGIAAKVPAGGEAIEHLVNGQPGLLLSADGIVQWVIGLDIRDGLISAVRLVANPDKLGAVQTESG